VGLDILDNLGDLEHLESLSLLEDPHPLEGLDILVILEDLEHLEDQCFLGVLGTPADHLELLGDLEVQQRMIGTLDCLGILGILDPLENLDCLEILEDLVAL
jgi:hypothetical protein